MIRIICTDVGKNRSCFTFEAEYVSQVWDKLAQFVGTRGFILYRKKETDAFDIMVSFKKLGKVKIKDIANLKYDPPRDRQPVVKPKKKNESVAYKDLMGWGAENNED